MAKYEDWNTPESRTLLRNWSREGFTYEQIAEKIGISVPTFYNWKKRYSEFAAAIKRGREVIDSEVEESLIKSALGYRSVEEKTEYSPTGEVLKITRIEKDIPPNVTALIFWLKNRLPEKWRDRRDTDIEKTSVPDIKINIEPVSPENNELLRRFMA